MANELDDMNGPVLEDGRDINVIATQIAPEITWRTKVFVVALWLLIIPGIIFMFKKTKAYEYLQQVQQKIQHNASQVDNYLEQRVVILQNVVGLVNKAVDLDKDTMKTIASYRGKTSSNKDVARNELQQNLDVSLRGLDVVFENYPELRAHDAIADAMRQNSYLQKEITAARELYNDSVAQWNSAIFEWPTKRIVAVERGYKTRIPFSASKEVKDKARSVFF